MTTLFRYITEMKIILILSLLFYSHSVFGTSLPRWAKLSRQLTLDSIGTPRSLVIRRLKKVSQLSDKIETGLNDPSLKPYALDIIAALQLKEFIPVLIKKIPDDPDGANVLTLNTLLDKSSYSVVAKAYKNFLQNLNNLSPVTTLSMVESLGRWGTPLPDSVVKKLLNHEFPEVRLVAIDFIAILVARYKKNYYLQYVPTILKIRPYQARLKGLYFLNSLPGTKNKLPFLKNCLQDKNILVRNLCRKFNDKWKDKTQ